MSIFDAEKYRTVYHDFDFLKGCFGDTRIMPTDVDGIVERRGRFLLMEFKPDGKAVSTGQLITLKRLKRLARLQEFTVVVVWHEPCAHHEPASHTSIQIMPSGKKEPVTTNGVRAFVSEWYAAADARRDMEW